MRAVNVSELGEFALIDRLAKIVGANSSSELTVGIGDDAAVWRSGERYLLATTDTLVEGVHFRAEWAAWWDIGWKALAVNVSDIVAMGGDPAIALVTLSLPPETPVERIYELYSGLGECARDYGVTVAGGDVVSASQFSVTIALTGCAEVRDGGPC